MEGILLVGVLIAIVQLIVIICVILWIKDTAKNTEETNSILADIDKNNQIRYTTILEELQKLNEQQTSNVDNATEDYI